MLKILVRINSNNHIKFKDFPLQYIKNEPLNSPFLCNLFIHFTDLNFRFCSTCNIYQQSCDRDIRKFLLLLLISQTL